MQDLKSLLIQLKIQGFCSQYCLGRCLDLVSQTQIPLWFMKLLLEQGASGPAKLQGL